MENTLIAAIVINIIYIIFWQFIIKVRKSKNQLIREWDNGFEFYNSLNDKDKEAYWKEDTDILNVFFIMMLIIIDITLILYYSYNSNLYWLMFLIIGLIFSIIVITKLSFKLRKKFREWY